ncbi:MAG: tRNA (N(6)-L-threonylcarbamoyladenosine(37)-C(2))-methylthiotransferase MtaB [Eubacteriales bacterium]
MKKVAFHTLGCKVNTYDTEAMMELFENSGYQIVDFDDKADVYVVNSCTVTNIGDKKSRQMIRKAKKQKDDSLVVVTGCYAQTAPEDLEQIPEVNLIVGTQDRNRIVDLVENITNHTQHFNVVKDIMSLKEYEELKISKVKDRIRAFIKIQEGCDQFCSYCIIPYARGPIRSRKIENIIKEAKEVASKGYKEIVVTGINVSSYGKDIEDVSLIDVLNALNEIEGIQRIRLSSLEPMLLKQDFIEKLLNVDKLCDHFHLSLQSGSDRILNLMNRRYTTKEYSGIIERIRKYYPTCSITTDVMVGFPEETENDFMDSLRYIERIGFSKLHVFKYSKRTGTPAAKNENQVPQWVKEERSKKLLALSHRLEEQYSRQFILIKKEVLFEQHMKERDDFYLGHTKNYLLVGVESKENIINQSKDVLLQGTLDNFLYGIIKQ